MPKVSTRSLRSLASKCNPSILTGAITESADYIDELETEIERLQAFIENLQVVHFTELQREKATVKRYEKTINEAIEECMGRSAETVKLLRKTLEQEV